MKPAYNLEETKGHHEITKDGIKPVEYVHQEYPKQVGEAIVKNEEEEKAALAGE